VDQGQRQADGDRREARRRLAVGGAHDHHQEHGGHHHLAQERGGHAVAARRQAAVAVAGEGAGLGAVNGEPGLALRDLQQDEGGQQAAQHLGDHVGHQVLAGETAPGPQAETDRRIEVRAGDVPERIRAGQHGQAERQRHAMETDPQWIAVTAELGRQHRAAAAAQHQPEGAEELGRQSFPHAHRPLPRNDPEWAPRTYPRTGGAAYPKR